MIQARPWPYISRFVQCTFILQLKYFCAVHLLAQMLPKANKRVEWLVYPHTDKLVGPIFGCVLKKLDILVVYFSSSFTKVKNIHRPNSPAPLTDDWKVTDDSSINFHDVFFFIFCQIIAKNEEKHVMEIYGWVVRNFPVVRKWSRWIRPMSTVLLDVLLPI